MADRERRQFPRELQPDEDPVLRRLGFIGEAKDYQRRCERIRELERDQRGPLAQMRASLGLVPQARAPVLDFPWDAEPSPAWRAYLAHLKKGAAR